MEPLSAFTRVFDALWRNPEVGATWTSAPHCVEPVIGPRFARTRWLHAGYEHGNALGSGRGRAFARPQRGTVSARTRAASSARSSAQIASISGAVS
jgi:hypothetical protein